MTADMRQELLDHIAHRRASIDEWLRANRPRSNRLGTVSIISSALAAVFVAGPALVSRNCRRLTRRCCQPACGRSPPRL